MNLVPCANTHHDVTDLVNRFGKIIPSRFRKTLETLKKCTKKATEMNNGPGFFI